MPVHNWKSIEDGIFHDLHSTWIPLVKTALNSGLLPPGYYVMAEQFGGDLGAPDVLTLQTAVAKPEPNGSVSGTATLTKTLDDLFGEREEHRSRMRGRI